MLEFEKLLGYTLHTLDLKYTKRDVEIKGEGGKTVFEMKDVEAPSTWSDNALKIVASKYFKIINGEQETSVLRMFRRVIEPIIAKGLEAGYFDKANSEIFENELLCILEGQLAFFNSPVWFNIGVPGRRQCPSACFLLDVEDHLSSIYDWIKCEALIFQSGSGAGVNLSNLRGENMALASGGTASGPLSFAKVSDTSAGVIKSGAVARRAAKMVILDADHPDIFDFIWCKADEEVKAQALIAAGFSGGINGEARDTVAFQNMNLSVRVTDDFMEKAQIDGNRELSIMSSIASAAWQCGDPGIQFQDTIDFWHTLPNSGRNRTSNPCGEFLSTPWSSCNLASINLQKVCDRKTLRHVVDIMITAMDILVELGEYPIEKIHETTKRQRQLGLGFSGLGAHLMACGIPYDSIAARDLAAETTALMTGEAYLQSAKIAKAVGEFEDFKHNHKEMLNVIGSHALAVEDLDDDALDDLWSKVLHEGMEYGFRMRL